MTSTLMMNHPQLSIDLRFQIHMLLPSQNGYSKFMSLSEKIKDIRKRHQRTRETLLEIRPYY